MILEDYAKHLKDTGTKIYLKKGVWWIQIKPFFCQPIYLFQKIIPGKSYPSHWKALFGYQHLVPEESMANSVLPVMMIEKKDILDYSLEKLKKKKRNQVKKGLQLVSIKKITEIEDLLRDGYQINISAVKRQGRKSLGYTDFESWKAETIKIFGKPGFERYGAYFQNKLVSYITTLELEDSILITQMMSHSDYLYLYPNDALIYTFLSQCKIKPDVERISFGLWSAKKSLNEFKKKLGFKRVDFPLFRHFNPLIKLIAPFTRNRHYLIRK